ncbi:hypothetical protein EB796_007048 [Bugula neritina]|uniref:Uncharacterized protein n=1 Tax=Bugula neritina TaxID=10212 RepID=A0A7J7K8V5_BUGNE|nr:hypothetical protein EB796_007048 [Bugula neritina]
MFVVNVNLILILQLELNGDMNNVTFMVKKPDCIRMKTPSPNAVYLLACLQIMRSSPAHTCSKMSIFKGPFRQCAKLSKLEVIKTFGYKNKLKQPALHSNTQLKSEYGTLPGVYASKSIQQLITHCQSKGRNGLIEEYFELKSAEPAMNFRTSKLPENMSKNRYADVLCLDVSRVILKGESYESDYINANYVDGFDHKKAYISTQGPLEHTVKDQWRLIFQENVRVIVMTTKLAERGRIKCDAYWPLEPLETVDYGKIKVVNLGIANKGDYQITLLEATHKETKEVRHIKHLQYLSWPDQGVPADSSSFLEFLFEVRKAQHDFTADIKLHSTKPPIIVHCSAGIGRTGTFIAIDIALYMYETTSKVNVERIVKNIRRQRAFSIQMPDQYLFCHLTLIQYAIKMEKVESSPDFKKILFGHSKF